MKVYITCALAALLSVTSGASRKESTIKDWQFSKDNASWNAVRIPHDWAIPGPFSRDNDLQKVAVEQNGETEETLKTGRTGGLPWVGKGYYETTIDIPADKDRSYELLFDGAMSHANVYVNGKHCGYWPYGYNSFIVNIDDAIQPGANKIRVELENLPESSRWYPGAGLYRNVHLIDTDKVHIPVWGTYVTTPEVSKEKATVCLQTELTGLKEGEFTLKSVILNPEGKEVASSTNRYIVGAPDTTYDQKFTVESPSLWSIGNPALYTMRTEVICKGKTVDTYDTTFGIRSIEYRPGDGFYLNGKRTRFRGVNNHHDLGPLGAAVNRSALAHQVEMLKDMGANSIRTSHNMPAQELVELCDENGMLMMIEPFDDWGFRPKCKNGYGTLFADWAEKDITNMVRHYRNNPSVVIWSIGNEVPSQWSPNGKDELNMLQDLVHKLDPTRPVTCGNDQFDAVVHNGFAAALDIPGFNYKVNRYEEAIDSLPQRMLIGTETASTVSSRGKYYFPVKKGGNIEHPDKHSSSYDVEYCYWSNIPDDDFAADDELNYNLGQFVWTGFDYLGEPTPYDTDAWPSHSSYFGIIDLASIPKDRYYLYRSRWNKHSNTLHILPHWNWPDRVGQVTPVYVYTDFNKAELFLNGKSQGVREKDPTSADHMKRYRLMWDDVVYEPGELKVVAYNSKNEPVMENIVRTAGKPVKFRATISKGKLTTDSEDLAYITIRVVDKDGNVVPDYEGEVEIIVDHEGQLVATANGDPTSLHSFASNKVKLFSGAATAIVTTRGELPGNADVLVRSLDKKQSIQDGRFVIPVVGKDGSIRKALDYMRTK